MNLKLLSIISTSVAVFAIVLLLTRGCESSTSRDLDRIALLERSNKRLTNDINAADAAIRAANDTIATIRKERVLEAKEHLKVTEGLQMREKALVRKLKEANADIQVIADSLPKVARYIELADSTIAVKDSLYTVERNHGIATEALYKSEIAQMAARNVHQQQISSILETKVLGLEDKNSKLERKLERRTKFNRVLLGVGLGLSAAITVLTLSQ